MKKVKDHFSTQSQLYAQFRPVYPEALYDYLYTLVPNREAAWDCGTGNGQVARHLAQTFNQVFATDISEKQIAQAPQQHNIQYLVTRAEETPFEDNTFDLTTVGQALHWFDFQSFFQEVKRVSGNKAILAVWGYGLLRISTTIDPLVHDFYQNIIGPYWDAERRHVDAAYQDIMFPFEEIESPSFTIATTWDINALEGFFNTWSSVQKCIKQTGKNPVPALIEKIRPLWKGELQAVNFPLFMRVGRISK